MRPGPQERIAISRQEKDERLPTAPARASSTAWRVASLGREWREVDAAAVLSLPLHQFHHHEGDRVQQSNGRAGRVGSRA